MENPLAEFDKIFAARKNEADEFYNELQKEISSEDELNIQRQALAGMLWSKQFYYYDVAQSLVCFMGCCISYHCIGIG
ncbi:MAG: hypothetical protein LH473_05795 [Chitinophagales bacterium]|nr:hypothetical protein [Chitinophagales bacterium]